MITDEQNVKAFISEINALHEYVNRESFNFNVVRTMIDELEHSVKTIMVWLEYNEQRRKD